MTKHYHEQWQLRESDGVLTYQQYCAACGERVEEFPTALVIDDGLVISAGYDGVPFTLDTAIEFATKRAEGYKPEHRSKVSVHTVGLVGRGK